MLPWTERSLEGVVVLRPKKPESRTRAASARSPARSVEKTRFPAPPLLFWVSTPVMAEVVVAFTTSLVLNERREPEEVAEASFERKSWSAVAPLPALVTSSFAPGVEVPTPTFPPAVAKELEPVDVMAVVEAYGKTLAMDDVAR